jgi:hypothetical protein
VVIQACKKSNGITNQPYTFYNSDPNKGLLKVNLAFAYTVDYSTIMIKLNDQVVGSALQTRQPFPGGGYNTRGSNYALYMPAPLGSDKVSVVLPKVGTTTDSVVLYSGTINMTDQGPYTLHITDTTTNTKTVLVKSFVSKVDTGFCRFRFVNLIPNMPAVDLYVNGTLVKSNLAYLQPTDTFSVRAGVNAPAYSGAAPLWEVRAAGAAATSTALAKYSSASALQGGRVMSIWCMGYSGVTGTRLPYLCFALDDPNYQ